MAGVFDLKFEQAFTATDTIVITHNANNDFLKVRLVIAEASRPDLIVDVKPTVANPRNELTVFLSSAQTGRIQIIETDVVSANELAASQPFEPGSILIALFASTAANVGNTFIETDNIAASDILPAPVVVDGRLQRVSFTTTASDGSGISGNIEIYKNQVVTPDITLVLADLQTQIFSVNLVINASDKLSCKISNGSGVAKPLVKMYQ